MNRRELLITGAVIILGLLMAFPLTWLSRPKTPSVSPRAIHQIDANGVDWALTPITGRSAAARAAGPETKPSLIVKTDIFQRGDREILISLILQDRDGRRYHPGIARDRVQLPAPTLRIVDENGKVVLDGKFQYG